MATYTYSKANDFPNQEVNLGDLEDEIRASVIVTALDYASVNADVVDIVFKATLSSGDQTELDNIVAAHQGNPDVDMPDQIVTDRGNARVEVQPASGIRKTIVSHDWCDPTTWYQDSERITDEVLDAVPNTSYKRYRADHKNWIDMYSGKIVEEEVLRPAGPYGVIVKVNDVTKTIGVDYRVDYRTGEVVFEWFDSWGNARGMGALTAPDVVKATYSHTQTSMFTIAPDANKMLRIPNVEVQFTQDVELQASIIFAAFAYNPLDLPNKIEVPGTRLVYKTARDFMSIGNQGVGQISPWGGNKRGVYNPVNVFPFNYQAATDLKSSQGAEIRMWIENDVPQKGEYSTATFYCLEEDE